jgi:hypothetical protein
MAPKKDDGMSPNVMLVIGLIGCGGLVVIALVATRLFGNTDEPHKPAPVAAPVAQSVNQTLKYSSGYYKATIEENAKKHKLSPPSVDQMALPLPYSDELSAPRTMKADKDQLDTPHLHLATHVAKEWASTGTAANLRVEHLMLSITNKSDRPIAYRVETKLGDAARCKNKAAIAHNAVALKPGETIQRSECMWSKNMTLEVDRIETIELSDLGYYYVSRLVPQQVLLGERVTQGHQPPDKLPLCSFVPWREIHASSETKGGVDWSDVLDFYARHNCDEYTFFNTYRRWTAPGTLPAQPSAQAPPATAPATTP